MTFQGCFLPSFDSFGKAVSEKILFVENNQSEKRIAFGGHICQRIGTKLPIFIKDSPRMLPTKFQFIWPSGFRGDNFLEINQSETRIVCGGHVCKRIGTKWAIFIEDLPRMLSTKFQFIWPSGFRGEDLKKSANQKQELPMAAMFVNGLGQNSNL